MIPLEQRVLAYWCLGIRLRVCHGAPRLRAAMELRGMLRYEDHPTLARAIVRRLGYPERGGFVIERPDAGGAA